MFFQEYVDMHTSASRPQIVSCSPPHNLFFLFVVVHLSIRVKKQALLSGFESEAKSLGAKADAVAAGTKDIKAGLERGMQGLRAHNRTVLSRHLKTAVKEARCVK